MSKSTGGGRRYLLPDVSFTDSRWQTARATLVPAITSFPCVTKGTAPNRDPLHTSQPLDQSLHSFQLKLRNSLNADRTLQKTRSKAAFLQGQCRVSPGETVSDL